MRNTLSKQNPIPQASASVVEGKLILSLPNAITPVVWQMDFMDISASALEVQENKKEKNFTLVMKTPKGDITPVAPFETKELAIEALMAASEAFANAQGNLQASGAAAGHPTIISTVQAESKGGKAWPIILSVVGVLILGFIWGSMQLQKQTQYASAQTSTASSNYNGSNARSTAGVAVSADDFLRGQ